MIRNQVSKGIIYYPFWRFFRILPKKRVFLFSLVFIKNKLIMSQTVKKAFIKSLIFSSLIVIFISCSTNGPKSTSKSIVEKLNEGNLSGLIEICDESSSDQLHKMNQSDFFKQNVSGNYSLIDVIENENSATTKIKQDNQEFQIKLLLKEGAWYIDGNSIKFLFSPKTDDPKAVGTYFLSLIENKKIKEAKELCTYKAKSVKL